MKRRFRRSWRKRKRIGAFTLEIRGESPQKLTINYGVRYDLPGNFSERHDLSSYWDPSAINRTVTGCGVSTSGPTAGQGIAGSPCPGDIFFVKTGINPGRSAVPVYKKEFMPRWCGACL